METESLCAGEQGWAFPKSHPVRTPESGTPRTLGLPLGPAAPEPAGPGSLPPPREPRRRRRRALTVCGTPPPTGCPTPTGRARTPRPRQRPKARTGPRAVDTRRLAPPWPLAATHFRRLRPAPEAAIRASPVATATPRQPKAEGMRRAASGRGPGLWAGPDLWAGPVGGFGPGGGRGLASRGANILAAGGQSLGLGSAFSRGRARALQAGARPRPRPRAPHRASPLPIPGVEEPTAAPALLCFWEHLPETLRPGNGRATPGTSRPAGHPRERRVPARPSSALLTGSDRHRFDVPLIRRRKKPLREQLKQLPPRTAVSEFSAGSHAPSSRCHLATRGQESPPERLGRARTEGKEAEK